MVAPDLMEWVPMLEVSLPRSCTAERSLDWTVEDEMVLRLPLTRIVLMVESSFVPG